MAYEPVVGHRLPSDCICFCCSTALWIKPLGRRLRASMIECLGVVSFEEEIKKREKLIYVPNWFIVDLKCGMPIIHLDEGDCLSAYINASDAGLLNEFNDPNYCYDTKMTNYDDCLADNKRIQNTCARL
ncbi:unnamed protein product [Schistosoma margrebowiei]|uniref:Uncharacterized protein n=1 Tax=Schistosoma margrebowiei TaxID=48269 RepID=A0A183M9S3_9TREM|nr:unnamed protein product [Schistosoma margrebowiei]